MKLQSGLVSTAVLRGLKFVSDVQKIFLTQPFSLVQILCRFFLVHEQKLLLFVNIAVTSRQ
jgi:hypothetical protein